MLVERGLSLHISEKANEQFKETLSRIGYTKLITLCFQVARNISDKVQTKDINKRYAINMALISVSNYYQNALSNGWKIYDSKYEYCGIRLKNYVENILGKKLSILKEEPTIEVLDNYDTYDPYGNNYPNQMMSFK